MTGMSEITAIGDVTAVPGALPVSEPAGVMGKDGSSRGSSFYPSLMDGTGAGCRRWENFEGAPKSLADVVRSLAEGIGTRGEVRGIMEDVTGDRSGESGGLGTSRPAGTPQSAGCDDPIAPKTDMPQSAGRIVPDAPKGDVVVGGGGLGTSRPADASQSAGYDDPVAQKTDTPQPVGRDDPIAPKGDVVVGGGGLGTSRPTGTPQLAGYDDHVAQKTDTPQPVGRDDPIAPKGDVAGDDDHPRIQAATVRSQENAVPIQAPVVQIQSADIRTQAQDTVLQVPRAHLAAAVRAVAEAIAVTPALAATGEGEISIRLKSDVLDGSSIRLEAKGGDLRITVIPASRAAEETLLKHHEAFQTQLAERVTAWRINVGVAALSPRHNVNHKLEEES